VSVLLCCARHFFFAASCGAHARQVELLPSRAVAAGRHAAVFLNVPMDGETPAGRLLRPQAWAQEALLRSYGGC
jgi:hypothetical protein